MREGAKYLIGVHDFVSFCNIRTNTQDTVRTVYDLTIEKKDDEIVLRITGNGFLYNMVRAIVGTCVYASHGKLEPEEIPRLLELIDRKLDKGTRRVTLHLPYDKAGALDSLYRQMDRRREE